MSAIPAKLPSGPAIRRKRLVWIAIGLTVLALAIGLVLYALNSNIVFFFTPTQIAANEAPQGRAFRVGGMAKGAG